MFFVVYFLTGINSVIDYEPGSGIKVVAKDSHLKLCDKKCDAKEITIKVKLTTDHIGKGCDRDTYSIQSQRKLCGKLCNLCYIIV